MAELKDVLVALGIAEDADPVAAIANMKAEIVSLKDTIATDPAKAAPAEMADMRRSLTEANAKLLHLQADFDSKLATMREERRQEQAKAKIDTLIARGKITKANQEAALDLALNLSEEKFDAIVATMASVDLTERGVATGSDMAELEPSAQEIAIAKQLGSWDDTKPAESRLALMRVKAKERGLVLPEVK